MNCNQAISLLHAYADGETVLPHSRVLEQHLRDCPDCARKLTDIRALGVRIRSEVPRFALPATLHTRITALADHWQDPHPHANAERRTGSVVRERWLWAMSGVAAGCAATVFSWIMVIAVHDWSARRDLTALVVTAHIRATLASHLIEVVSSDQHTVKPWLSKQLDYSPPVRDLADEGFALQGARIEALEGQRVAVLVYRFHDHSIDVFVQPEAYRLLGAAPHTVRGFNVVNGNASGMEWIAVSDLNTEMLSGFVKRLTQIVSIE